MNYQNQIARIESALAKGKFSAETLEYTELLLSDLLDELGEEISRYKRQNLDYTKNPSSGKLEIPNEKIQELEDQKLITRKLLNRVHTKAIQDSTQNRN